MFYKKEVSESEPMLSKNNESELEDVVLVMENKQKQSKLMDSDKETMLISSKP
jgi:hypothetical protein